MGHTTSPGRNLSAAACPPTALVMILAAWLAAPDHAQPQRPRFAQLTKEHGLSDDTVEAIVEDRRGFMWFGTPDGLDRYDAHSFNVYRHDPADPASLSSSYVLALFEDREGTLWVGTLNGLNRYVRETDSFIRYQNSADPASLSHNTVFAFCEDRRGRLWVSTGRGVNRLDRATGTFARYLQDDPGGEAGLPNARSLAEDRLGNLWVGVEGRGLKRLDPETGRVEAFRHRAEDPGSLSHDDVWDLLVDRGGDLWVATLGGLDRWDPSTGRFAHFRHDAGAPASLSSDHVDTVFEDSRGILWVGTDGGGLDQLDRATGAAVAHRHDPADATSLGGDVVRAVYEDSKGDLWVGTYTGGVSFFNRNNTAFSYYRHLPRDPDSLSDSAVRSFFEDPDGTLWIGTEGGLNRFDRETGRCRRFRHRAEEPRSLSADAVLSILRDSGGRLWIGTYYGGLNRLDSAAGNGTFTRYLPDADDPRSLSNPHVWDVFEDSTGELWLGTFGGVNRFDPDTGEFVRYLADPDDDTTIGHSIVWSFYEDRGGALWLATQEGLSLYDRARDAFRTWRHDDADPASPSQNPVLSILEDRAGRLWLGTEGGGLVLFDREAETFRALRTPDGLPNDVVYGMLEDDRGRLWLATKEGLSRFDPATSTFTNYNRSDGLLSYPFSRNACLTSARGEMFFGGTHGFSSFLPQEVHDNPEVPPIVLTEFQVFNRPVSPGAPGSPLARDITEARRIRLRHDQSVFSLAFSALNYRAPDKNRYAHKLEGFDRDWSAPSPRRAVTYTNLDPGEYVFRVKGSNNSGLWNEEGARVRLTVAPPYWATWWFRLACVLAAAGLLLGAYAWRTQGIRARNRALQAEIAERQRVEAERRRLLEEMEVKNRELEHFTYTVSHDLKAPLVTIKGFLGMLEKDARAGDAERMRHDMERIGAAADKMHRLVGELLELSRVGRQAAPVETVALSDLAREAAALFTGGIEERGIELQISADMPVVTGDRVRLLQVFQNLIDNAVKYMGEPPSPRIEVGAVTDGAEVLCHVRDNGQGIEAQYREKVFGLFERLDTEVEGTGVGLALVKRIVEIHGGRVWVESDGAGRGCTFYFTLSLG